MAKAKKTKLPRRGKTQRSIEEGHIGYETTEWSDVPADVYQKKVVETMRHYGYFYEKKAYQSWMLAWIKEHMPEHVADFKAAEAWRCTSTMSSLCKMELNGCILSESSKEFQLKCVEELLENGKTNRVANIELDENDEPVKAPKRKTPQELLAEKTNEFIGEIEGCVDDFCTGDLDSNWSLYDEMRKLGTAAQSARDIISYYSTVKEELRELIEDKTEDLVEGYSNMTVKEQKAFYNFISEIISDCEKFIISKKATRKPRAKKVTPLSKQVEKVLYLKESPEYKIASVTPEQMVGAHAMYLFNTKTRVMKYLVSDRRDGFLVKGSTVHGYDQEESFKKMLRKPEAMLETIGKASKSKALKEFKALKTKESTTDARINRDTVILKIVR
tara:strand:- start:3161 stop:4321 length:1161 start_codon:yes stop_codon:yes gene_type:complete